MKLHLTLSMVCMVFLMSVPVTAMNMDHGKGGKTIHTSTVDNATLSYMLMDIRENMKAMGHDMGDTATHHLMVYVKGANLPEKGKAGFMITGPDGKTEKVMCMAMEGGYGADIRMKSHGAYTIKVKVAGDGKALKDEFTYTLNH